MQRRRLILFSAVFGGAIGLSTTLFATVVFASAPIQVTNAETSTLIIVAGIGFAGTILATILAAYLQARNARKASDRLLLQQQQTADKAAKKAEDVALEQKRTTVATSKAAKVVAQTLQATTELTSTKLDDIKSVTDGVHQIVNSQRNDMKQLHAADRRTIAILKRQIGDLDASDAEKAADVAEAEARDSQAATDAMVTSPTTVEAVQAINKRSRKTK